MKPQKRQTPLLLCLLLLFPHSQSTSFNTASYTQAANSSDLVFKDNLLWNITLKTRIQCAVLCARHTDCVAFTATKVASLNVTCRGHSQDMTSGGHILRGSRYYHSQTDGDSSPPESPRSAWLSKACSSDTECSQTDAECFANKCVCTPGYYFSVGQDSCQASCSDLQQDFVMYPRWYVSFNNMDDAIMTFTQCRTWCTSLANCVTLEYNFDISKCYVASVTAQDSWSDWKQSIYSNLSYWQRTCA
ncbi:uncharacterized protein LOC143301607 [Babylonia areolata]|uniref:uncharacterized protein LOC143301607 n=1 Tax=Babylonia areolata TaxID=304850 RepID=UPI003FD583E8